MALLSEPLASGQTPSPAPPQPYTLPCSTEDSRINLECVTLYGGSVIKKCLIPCLLALLATSRVADAKQQADGFRLSGHTQTQHYNVSLSCDKALSVGSFQACHLDVFRLDDKNSMQIVKHAKISMGGGMPAHHHGLPTSPVVKWSATKNTYLVEGLKFSMPGEWELRFLIESDPAVHTNAFTEKVVFTFTL